MVEGFAARVAAGDVPEVLKKVTVRTLDGLHLATLASVRRQASEKLAESSIVLLKLRNIASLSGAEGTRATAVVVRIGDVAIRRGHVRLAVLGSPSMPRIEFTVASELPPERIMAAATDFSDRRPDLWPNISRRFYKVHDKGEKA